MFSLAMTLFFVALMAELLGFTGLAAASLQIGLVFVILFVAVFLGGSIFGRPSV